jgi:flagellar motor switch protein FliM
VPANASPDLRDVSRAPGVEPDVALYDFRRPTKLSREHIRTLQIAFETFSRRMTTLLTSGLRQVCSMAVADIVQVSYEEYVTSLDATTLMVPIAMPPLQGTGVWQFSLPMALASIDYMLGGPGGTQPDRTLTEIETTLLMGLLEQMVGSLRYSFEPIVAVTPSLGAIEYNPQFLQAGSATDAMIVTSFDMVVGSETCQATLCLPLAPLLPLLVAQRPRRPGEEDDVPDATSVRQRVKERLGDVPMSVSVEFAPLSLSPARILSLAEGDIVRLDHRVGVPLSLQAAGTVFAHAIAGKSGSKLAALVVDSPLDPHHPHQENA